MAPRSYPQDASSSGNQAVVVTPSAGTDLPKGIAKGVEMLAAGDLSVIPARGDEVITYTGVPAGFSPKFRVRRVTACTSSCVAVYD